LSAVVAPPPQQAHEPHGACRNCGTELVAPPAPHYCPQCGQETALHPPSLREFLHEFVGHYIALEGALWKTLALLVLRPGRLTREYFAGRRRRYVLPLRLYLSASFLFFVLIKLVPSTVNTDAVKDTPEATRAAAAAQLKAAREAATDPEERAALDRAARAIPASGAASAPPPPGSLRACVLPGARCGRVKTIFGHVAQRWHSHPRESMEHFKSLLTSTTPYGVFLMLPLFAALMMLAYRQRRMLYGEHVVFSLHIHAFLFLALLVLWLLPGDSAGLAVFLVPVYGTWAMRNVYGGRWWTTLLRALFVTVTYGLLLILGTMLLVIGVLLVA
jgi:hypothetical protein